MEWQCPSLVSNVLVCNTRLVHSGYTNLPPRMHNNCNAANWEEVPTRDVGGLDLIIVCRARSGAEWLAEILLGAEVEVSRVLAMGDCGWIEEG